MAEGKFFARIHPDARQDQTVVRRRDTCGIIFERGVGPYKGWHPVSDEQADKLRRVFMSPNNPNSMRIFQLEEREQVDKIAGSEARARMTPEAKRIDQARDGELAMLKQKLAEMEQTLAALGGPGLIANLVRLAELNAVSAGLGMSAEAGDRIEKIAAGPARRPNLDERMLDDETTKRAPVAAQVDATNKPAPAPAARPGAVPGAQPGKKSDAKKQPQESPAARPGTASVAQPVAAPAAAPSADDLANMASILDDDDNN